MSGMLVWWIQYFHRKPGACSGSEMSPVLHGLMLSRDQTMQGDSTWSWRGWWRETVEIQTDVVTVAADQSFLSFVYSPVLASVGFCLAKSEVYFYWPLCGEGNAIGRVRPFFYYIFWTCWPWTWCLAPLRICHHTSSEIESQGYKSRSSLGFGFRNGKVAFVVTQSVWHRSSIDGSFSSWRWELEKPRCKNFRDQRL